MFATITPINTIFTGVAGTGKTYQLQQLAKDYTKEIAHVTKGSILKTLVEPLSWREVICLVFLEHKRQGKDLLKVADIVEHEFFNCKATLNKINTKHSNQTVWGNLQKFSSPSSTTVKQSNRASQAYFDKDETSSWYLLESAMPLLKELQVALNDYLDSKPMTLLQQRYAFVSFHQSYGYDEFVEGIRPTIDKQTGQMQYDIRKGVFLELCEKAEQDPEHRYAMLIDEINRANVAQVFGELMSLIEPSKRAGQPNAMSVQLAYSGNAFSVPSNVDIFATMNTQDHSLVNLDSAFRRRFEFVEILPDSNLLGKITDDDGNSIDLAKLLDGLNRRIRQHLGEHYQLGQAYFYHINDMDALLKVMVRQVLPQLMTYTVHNPQALGAVLQLNNPDNVNVTEPWLLASDGTNPQFGQASYHINPQIQKIKDNSIVVKAVESLY